ncbi:hypothetical protein SAMN04488238_1516, partial [Roseicitreum antarcticum]
MPLSGDATAIAGISSTGVKLACPMACTRSSTLTCSLSVAAKMRFTVTGRLLPRWFCPDAGDEFLVMDEVVEEFMPA